MLNCLKFHHIIHHTTTSKYHVLAKNDILGSWLIACCKLAPTLVRQVLHYNDVIRRNEYLISTFFRIYHPLGIFTAIFV